MEVKREVNNLKKGLIEVMKQGLEKDITATMEMEEKITSMSALIKNNKEEIDSCFSHGSESAKYNANTKIKMKRKVDEGVFEGNIDEKRDSRKLTEINVKLAVLSLLLTGVFYFVAFDFM